MTDYKCPECESILVEDVVPEDIKAEYSDLERSLPKYFICNSGSHLFNRSFSEPLLNNSESKLEKKLVGQVDYLDMRSGVAELVVFEESGDKYSVEEIFLSEIPFICKEKDFFYFSVLLTENNETYSKMEPVSKEDLTPEELNLFDIL